MTLRDQDWWKPAIEGTVVDVKFKPNLLAVHEEHHEGPREPDQGDGGGHQHVQVHPLVQEHGGTPWSRRRSRSRTRRGSRPGSRVDRKFFSIGFSEPFFLIE
jgi:hypothetical protein